MKRLVIWLCCCLLGGCATTYGPGGFTGGYRDRHVDEDVYRVTFSANGYATRETAQTYWLYRAAELTLEKKFDGFEILSPVSLGQADEGGAFMRTAFIYIPIFTPNRSDKPLIEADIRLLKGPVKSNPPKVFEARTLLEALTPYVKGEKKCDGGNVCPHIKRYLMPETNPAASPSS